MKNKIIDYLDELYPNPKCELEYHKDYELLIATVLSAQCTDKRVNMVTKELFSKYNIFDLLHFSIGKVFINLFSVFSTESLSFESFKRSETLFTCVSTAMAGTS